MGVAVHALPPGEGYLDEVACCLLSSGATDLPDLSGHLCLVSSLPLAAELRAALSRRAARPLLLPHFDTLRRWVQAADLPDLQQALPESERLVLLHSALASKGWFDERALWGVAAELTTLADELSAASVQLAADQAALIGQLEAAYALRASAPLTFEARVVHEMWRALSMAGRADAPSVYRLRLARLADEAICPLSVVLDGPPEERLSPAETAFLERYSAHQPVSLCFPRPCADVNEALPQLLSAAWPEKADLPLAERARKVRAAHAVSPLAGRLQLVSVHGREAEAEAVAAQVFAWLGEGLRRIALIAEDRLTARRVRALLERQQVLASDETGWKLTTTRAAASIDALLENVAANAYHLDLLDLLKSPHVFADVPLTERAAAVLLLERAIRSGNEKSGIPAFRRLLSQLSIPDAETGALIGSLLDRVEVAIRMLSGKAVPLAQWLDRLQRALAAIGADQSLGEDAAGSELIALLVQRQTELADSTVSFPFASWRDWLNRELESGSFRDRGITSSIVMLPRHDSRLRRFEAAIVIGADAGQMAVGGSASFFNQAVRRDLGLSTHDDSAQALRRDIELLLLTVPRIVVTWQREQGGEACLLAPEFELLSTLHQMAWGDDLHRAPLRAALESQPSADTCPALPQPSRPVVSAALLPERISVSGLSSLVACPYQFFARHVLHLNELDEVLEALGKSDYGQLVHRSLERFHQAYPVLAGIDDETALQAMTEIVETLFSGAEADNWLALGWRLRWQQRLPAYLAWQRAREAEGWRWQAAELNVAKALPLADGSHIELYGRIDRLDSGPQGDSLLDYKTKSATSIRKLMVDDIQLPAYALLHGALSAEAAYVALDDDLPRTIACADDLAEAAAAQGQRLVDCFSAMRAGASLPAHGSDAACSWCEMRGLCRRDHVLED